jgi:hypothetical protein
MSTWHPISSAKTARPMYLDRLCAGIVTTDSRIVLNILKPPEPNK